MKVILLAAGEGKRLRPHTLRKPKCMVEVDGISLIDLQIDIIKSCGISDITIIGGYKSEKLIGKGTEVIINERYSTTNMVYSLFCAIDKLEDEVIVSYGDIVYSKGILNKLIKSKNDISVTIDKNWKEYWCSRNENPLDDAETLKVDNKGVITEIGQKPQNLSEIEGQYMGLMKFKDHGLDVLKSTYYDCLENGLISNKSVENAYMTDILMEIITRKHKVIEVPIYLPWIEVDTCNDLKSNLTLGRIKSIKADLL